jgi:membrane protease subunit HflC
MRRIMLFLVLALAGVTGLIAAGRYDLGPVVITPEDQLKVILTLGDPRKVTEPGWALRAPLVETVKTYDRRLLTLDMEPASLQTKDQERLEIDNYVVWRIREPVRFYSSFPVGMSQAELQIDRAVRASVREVIGQHTVQEVVTDLRGEIMTRITSSAGEKLGTLGVEIEDVRLNKTEPPPAARQNIYARMQTERDRLARKYRAEGEERARRIRAQSDREARVIVANATKESEILRGEGDAKATAIYAEAYTGAPDFYAFVRSLEAYRKSIGEHTTLVLSPNTEFFQYFQGIEGRESGGE